MIENENMVHLIWIFIFSLCFMVSTCLISRKILICLINRNIFSLRTIFSNTRILQSAEERQTCDVLAKSLFHTFQSSRSSNIHNMIPVHPQFVSTDLFNGHQRNDGNSSPVNHWPLFQIAVDGKIIDPQTLIATKTPSYNSVVGNTKSTMLTTDYFRNNVQPLGVNTSLNRHDDSRNNFGSGAFSGYNSQDHVPVDRPLFVNTSMSAQQRVDLYRRLSDPPKDNEPALAFSFRHY